MENAVGAQAEEKMKNENGEKRWAIAMRTHRTIDMMKRYFQTNQRKLQNEHM